MRLETTIPTYEPALHLFVSVFVVCITTREVSGIVLINVLAHLNSSFNFLDWAQGNALPKQVEFPP